MVGKEIDRIYRAHAVIRGGENNRGVAGKIEDAYTAVRECRTFRKVAERVKREANKNGAWDKGCYDSLTRDLGRLLALKPSSVSRLCDIVSDLADEVAKEIVADAESDADTILRAYGEGPREPLL